MCPKCPIQDSWANISDKLIIFCSMGASFFPSIAEKQDLGTPTILNQIIFLPIFLAIILHEMRILF